MDFKKGKLEGKGNKKQTKKVKRSIYWSFSPLFHLFYCPVWFFYCPSFSPLFLFLFFCSCGFHFWPATTCLGQKGLIVVVVCMQSLKLKEVMS
jgi:hypothetical protein